MKIQCSFCCKDNMEVAYMVRGDEAVICNECVCVCVEIIAEAMKVNPATANFPFGSMGEYL